MANNNQFGGGLFGSKSPASGSSPFGQQPNSSGGLFGNTPASSGASSQPGQTTSLFGAANPSSTSGNLFGAGNPGASSGGASVGGPGIQSGSGFSFGKPAGNAAQSSSPSLFGAQNTPAKTSSTEQSAQTQTSLFAQGTTTPNKSFSLGQPSTTPAGPPPSGGNGSLFGSKSGAPGAAPSIFGQKTQAAGGLFGGSNKSGDPPASQSPSLFGSANKNSESSEQASQKTLFGSPAPSVQTTSLFGQNSANAGSSAPAGSGAPAASSAAPTMNPPKSTPPTASGNPFNKPTEPSDSSKQSQAPSLFGQKADNSSSAAPTSNLFGQNTTSAQPQQGTTSIFTAKTDGAAQASSTPATLFGQRPEVNKSQASASPFGGADQHKAGESAPSTSGNNTNATTAAPTSSTAGTSLFGAAPKSTAETEKSSAATASFGATAGPAAGAAGGASTLGSSTTGPPPSAQSRLKNKSMDEIITRWASDLTKYQKEFQAQAEKVASWDRQLVENSNAISKLYSRTFQAERDTAEVQKQLTAVESQQDELAAWLDRYEKEVDEMLARQVGQGDGMQGPDQERERTYRTAEKVSERLTEMNRDLTGMIEEINSASAFISKTSKADDPLSHVVRILNSHLSELQKIDAGTVELKKRVAEAQRDSQRLNSRGLGGLGYDAADDFGRTFRSRG